VDLDDAILLLRDPRLGKRGMILAAKLAARELGPVVFVDGDELWNNEKMMTDEEWVEFARFLRAMVRRKGAQRVTATWECDGRCSSL
jgi:D-aminopeptidase